jgi:2-amino-4-hydroxy-6-hydroxymethyldihydropteridine diphosphokinase
VGGEAQPRYLNAVVRVETTLPPRALLQVCLEIERGLGRDRPPGVLNAPRNIDLDLLLVGDLVQEEPGLQLPHPRLLQRPFVRVPLAAVAETGLCHPGTRERLDRAAPHPDVHEVGGL